MKITTVIPAILALSAVSFGSFAAQEVNTSNQNAIGYVSVTGADTLEDLTAQLSKKADEAGASSFRIVSAGGEDQMMGVAELYK